MSTSASVRCVLSLPACVVGSCVATSPAVDLHYAVCLLYAYYMRTCRRSRVAPSDDCHFPPALIRLGLDRSLYGDLVRGRWSYLFDSMLWSLLHPYPHFA